MSYLEIYFGVGLCVLGLGAMAVTAWDWFRKPFQMEVDWDFFEGWDGKELEEQAKRETRGYCCVDRDWNGRCSYVFWKLPHGYVARTFCRLYGWFERGKWGFAPFWIYDPIERFDWPIIRREGRAQRIPKWYGWVWTEKGEKTVMTWAWLPLAPILRPIYRKLRKQR